MEKQESKPNPKKNEFKKKLTDRITRLAKEVVDCRISHNLTSGRLDREKAEVLRLRNDRQPLANRVRILNKNLENIATEHKALKFLYTFACLRNEELLIWLKRATEAEGAEEIKEFMEAGVILLEEIAKEDKLRERTNKKAGISAPAVTADEADGDADPKPAEASGADDGELCRAAQDEPSPCVED